MVRIDVHDDGIGIAPERVDAVFERFTQADDSTTRAVEGAGLGLALSKELAHRLGGTLTAVSTLGEGSTFTLTLPLEPTTRIDSTAPNDAEREAHG